MDFIGYKIYGDFSYSIYAIWNDQNTGMGWAAELLHKILVNIHPPPATDRMQHKVNF